MQKEAKNKMIGGKEDATVKKDKYFYPDHQITIEAESKEEADKLLEAKLKGK